MARTRKPKARPAKPRPKAPARSSQSRDFITLFNDGTIHIETARSIAHIIELWRSHAHRGPVAVFPREWLVEPTGPGPFMLTLHKLKREGF